MKLTMVKVFGLVVFVSSLAFFITSAWPQMMGHEGMRGMPGKKEGMEHKGMSGYGGGYGGGPFDIDMLKDQLKLNDDQVAKLKKIRSDYQKEMIRRHANMQVAQMELWEILDNKNLDMAKAEKKVKEVEGMRSDLMVYRIKALQETRKFLTDEQYEQFREMGFRSMRGMMGKHGMRGGMGGRMGGGMGGGMHDDDD
ncbi:MAG: Spy/CpxP family protein refolding chaperone [Nitrospira sp.]|nr:Spy/CpxP family protein refolding chaperone [Nitrospira sp.]